MDRREFLAGLAGVGLALGISIDNSVFADNAPNTIGYPYQLPALSFDYAALEPYIDARTMEIHYTKHHDAYVKKLNEIIAKTPGLESKNLYELMASLKTIPLPAQNIIRNNAGGHFNHTFFWEQLVPEKQAVPTKSTLDQQIQQQYGTIADLKAAFNKAAMGVFGSGWVWLVKRQNNSLGILTTPNQDNPLMDVADTQALPILGLDVWEHAYYLKYQNRRVEYCEAFWHILNWGVIAKRYAQ